MKEIGYIKLHRKILENPIVCKDCETFSIWLYLLLSATHQEIPAIFKGEKIILKKGQLITGILSISKKLKINKDKIQRTLKCFENDKQIEQQTSNKNRLITILNWEQYQNNNKQIDKQVINKCETDDKQLITNKNDNNIKNEKNIIKKEKEKKKKTFDDVFTENNFSELLEMTLRDFIDMRKSIKKPMTTKALELLINNLNKLSNNDEEKIAILNQSIERSWQTVYPLKTIKPLNEVRETKEEKFKREQKESWERWLNKDD